MGLTPQLAIAGTASCMAASRCPSDFSSEIFRGLKLIDATTPVASSTVGTFQTVDVPMFAINHDPVHTTPRQKPGHVGAR